MLIERFLQIGICYTSRSQLCMIIGLNKKAGSPDMKLMMLLWMLNMPYSFVIGLK